MRRNITLVEKFFITGLGLIFLFLLLHDWIPLGPLNDLQGIRDANSLKSLILTTIINVFSISVVIGITLVYIGKRYPIWARIWLIVHLGAILYGAISAWWIPYFFGTDNEIVERYNVMFGDTQAFLPVMNGIVPNTVHVLFHVTLFICWLLNIFISLKNKKQG